MGQIRSTGAFNLLPPIKNTGQCVQAAGIGFQPGCSEGEASVCTRFDELSQWAVSTVRGFQYWEKLHALSIKLSIVKNKSEYTWARIGKDLSGSYSPGGHGMKRERDVVWVKSKGTRSILPKWLNGVRDCRKGTIWIPSRYLISCVRNYSMILYALLLFLTI